MKKIIIIFLIMFLVIGCDSKKNVKETIDKVDEVETTDEIVEEIKDTYVDDNPIKLGMYIYTNSWTDRKLTSEYSTAWTLNVDLCSLEVYYVTDEAIPGTNQKRLWDNYYKNYQDIDSYHIGYKIEFSTTEGNVSKTILSPADTEDVYDYMQIYLYDDINQSGGWYDHVDSNEYNDETMLTSIKLTGSTKTNEITSDITLSAFTYDSNNADDFDDNNEYRGVSKFTTIIKRS